MPVRNLVTWALVLLIPTVANAFPNEPKGYGEARFGMTFDEVRKIFPEMVAAGPPAMSDAGLPLVLETHELRDQTILGLSDCRARLDFGNLFFYRVWFECPGSKERIFEALSREFGEASEAAGGNVHWLSDASAVSVNPRNLIFAFADRKLDRSVQLTAFSLMKEAPEPVTPEPEPSKKMAETPPTKEPQAEASPPLGGFDWFADRQRFDQALRQLEQSESPIDIIATLNAIATHEDPRASKHVKKLLAHEDPNVFETAMYTLEFSGGPDAVRAVGSLLGRQDVSPERRLRAVQALFELRDVEGVTEELEKGLADPDEGIRKESAMNIIYSGDAAVLPLRRAYAREKDEITRKYIARALEILGAKPEESAQEGASGEVAGRQKVGEVVR